MINEYDIKQIKIAFLVQAYSDSIAFKLLVSRLLDIPECHIFVHIDKKSDIGLFYIANERIHYIKNRELVSWAGYNQAKLIFNLIEESLSYGEKFDYYCFLSESDFPVFKGNDLIKCITNQKTYVVNCSICQKEKVKKYWFYDFGIKSPKLNKYISKISNFISNILYRGHILEKDNYAIINNEKAMVYCSGPFWTYNHDVITYLFNTYKSNSQMQKYFKYSFAPCELIIPTILMNSKYKDECIEREKYVNLNDLSSQCYFKYNGPRVNVLTVDDYDDIINSKKPFIRKVDVSKSASLIEKIMAQII